MRQVLLFFCLSIFLFASYNNASAALLVRGYYIDTLPENVVSKPIKPGNSIILAHVFNPEKTPIEPGSYKIGVEIVNNGKKRTFAITPESEIKASTLKTFRLALPISDTDRLQGNFRIFTQKDEINSWSDTHSFSHSYKSMLQPKGIKTLYTEAPSDVDTIVPPPEVPFENLETKNKIATLEKETQKIYPEAVAAKPAVAPATKSETIPVLPVAQPPQEPIQALAQKAPIPNASIDLSEFKTLRTIDEELVIYVVKNGDNLASIAERYYGSPNKKQLIADLNFIQNHSSIRVGEEIIVDVKPIKYDTKTSVQSGNFDQIFSSNSSKTYVIQRGDTLSSIAQKKLGKSSDVNKIIKANPGINPNRLSVGQEILIPSNNGDNAS